MPMLISLVSSDGKPVGRVLLNGNFVTFYSSASESKPLGEYTWHELLEIVLKNQITKNYYTDELVEVTYDPHGIEICG